MLTHSKRRSCLTYFLALQLFLMPIALRNYYFSINTRIDAFDREALDNDIASSRSKEFIEAKENLQETLIEVKKSFPNDEFKESTSEPIVPTSTAINIDVEIATTSQHHFEMLKNYVIVLRLA